MNPKYPIYVVSKSRWDKRFTVKTLEKMKVPYTLVIEPEEYDEYVKVVAKENLLTVPLEYRLKYDTCDDLGLTKSVGPGAARNYCWDDAVKKGFSWHWVMDDNIYAFHRNNHNKYIVCGDGTPFRVMEDFVERYRNVAMAGPNYFMFLPRKTMRKPFVTNTRIYSCNFIRNDTPFRWRGRYNEDTDLSLRMLKAGWCTIQFNAFTQFKAPTQTVQGGNTKEFYSREGTLPKSKMQVQLHPDVSTLVWKFGRWHHKVDYRRFQRNKLILKDGVKISNKIDNYGMALVDLTQNNKVIEK